MKFNKFNLSIAGLYILGFIFILLNFLTIWLNLVAIIIFTITTIMLTISFYFSSKRKNAILSSENDEIIMELALNEETESYVPVEKKQGKFKNLIENLRIFSPCILSGLLSIVLITLLVLTIIKL